MKQKYIQLLSEGVEKINISPSDYKKAVNSYKAVGEYLENGEYDNDIEVKVYPQGSFALGTVIKPIQQNNNTQDYDVDLVSVVQTEKNITSPEDIKSLIGNRLKEHKTYNKMLEPEGKRCWTLKYSDNTSIGFHMDILPSTPEDEQELNKINADPNAYQFIHHSLAITDKSKDTNLYNWNPSNPKGYAEWFHQKSTSMIGFESFKALKKSKILQENNIEFKAIEDIPDQIIGTPLQQAVQILKRHRDISYLEKSNKEQKYKPISMIITTLSAYLYQGEDNVYDALKTILDGFAKYTELLISGKYNNEGFITKNYIDDEDKWQILNPTNHDENFADRWHEDNNERALHFFQWQSIASEQLVDILDIAQDEEQISAVVTENIIYRKKEEVPHIDISDSPKNDFKRVNIISNPEKPWLSTI